MLVMCAGLSLVACKKVGSEAARRNPAGATVMVREPSDPFEHYASLGRAVERCTLESYQITPTCPALRALDAALETADPAIAIRLGTFMLRSESPAVRVKGAALAPDAIATTAPNEMHPGVLQAFVRATRTRGTDPMVARLLLAAADHASPEVRLQAVAAIAQNRGMAGGAEKLVALAQHDDDANVRHSACELGGKLASKLFLPVYEAATANAKDPAQYAACMEGLVAMFHNHPTFDTHDRDAYELFLKRLEAKPRSEDAPPWTVMSTFCYFSHESDLDRLAAWKQRATWFDPTRVKKVLASVVADKRTSWMARAAAVESMVGLGATKTELGALRRGYTGQQHDDKAVLAKLASAMAD
jgi:hypothetical protein